VRTVKPVKGRIRHDCWHCSGTATRELLVDGKRVGWGCAMCWRRWLDGLL
jgi:hypothetical protein